MGCHNDWQVGLVKNSLYNKLCFFLIVGGGIWLFIWIIRNGGWMPLATFGGGVGMYLLMVMDKGEPRD